MKKTKYMLTGFAIFAAAIMLLTPCMARPVAEKTTMDAVEQSTELNSVLQSLSEDEAIIYAVGLIEAAITEEEFASGFDQLGFALEKNPSFVQLEDLLNDYTNDLTGESDMIGFLQNMDGEILIPGIGWTSPGGDIDGGQAEWAGFAINLDGGKLIPGYGWIYPDDEAWDYWLAIESYLMTLPLGYVTEILAEIEDLCNNMGPGETILDLIIEIILEIMRIVNDIITEVIADLIVLIINICLLAFLAVTEVISVIIEVIRSAGIAIAIVLEVIIEVMQNIGSTIIYALETILAILRNIQPTG